MSVKIDRITVEHYPLPSTSHNLGVSHPTPRLSWRFSGSASEWTQASYELTFVRGGDKQHYVVESKENVLVPWPSQAGPIKPREKVIISVEVVGSDGKSVKSQELTVEGALADDGSDWKGELISLSGSETKDGEPKRPFLLRKTFTYNKTDNKPARLYATAHGIYEISINSKRVGDHLLAPGWQSYNHRLHYQTYDLAEYLTEGENTLTAWIGEGWYAGELAWMRKRVYGERIGLLAQIEVGGEVVLKTSADKSEGWQWKFGEITRGEIYDGESWDYSQASSSSGNSWRDDVEFLGKPKGHLISPETPPVRATQELQVQNVITTPKGKTVLDFGQNLVGWVKINSLPSGDGTLTLIHAEVMEKEELGTRPLRTAKCTDHITLSDSISSGQSWEPKFTFHGFRYVQVDGLAEGQEVYKSNFTAVVIHTDMERTGWFECSHKLLNKLHENATWGMRGNFVSVPTDCPQRDERLGWTGDLQVFAPTANFLYDTRGMLGCWLQDLKEEQIKDLGGNPQVVVPDVLSAAGWPKMAQAVWSDIAILLPRDLHEAFGDTKVLELQWDSMVAWLEQGVKREEDGLWDSSTLQLGDWLDPSAPPDQPGEAKTDAILVANAYLVHVTEVIAALGDLIGKKEAPKYREQAANLKALFNKRYITPDGRLVSDSQTAYTLALKFGLLAKGEQSAHGTKRLEYLLRKNVFKIGTGFAGTPSLLHALAENDSLGYAYRVLQEGKNPSWLYPVKQGATTIWERWDSMLPDGSINPGEMTSFNHYALGSVASFMHKYIGGISSTSPGWQSIRIAPRPGGTITNAKVSHLTPYGPVSCEWEIKNGDKLHVVVEVPPNTSAEIDLPGGGKSEKVGSGRKEYEVDWEADESWPPKAVQVPFGPPVPDEPEL